jgi:hypothetical protein
VVELLFPTLLGWYKPGSFRLRIHCQYS